MATETDAPFTPAQRLNRGLTRTLSGPIDVARGAVGLTAQAISSVASGVKGRYRASKLRRDVTDAQNALRHEFAAAQDAVTSLPQTVAKAKRRDGGRRAGQTATVADGDRRHDGAGGRGRDVLGGATLPQAGDFDVAAERHG